MKKIKVKRPVTIKTIVTPQFKDNASNELSKEIHLLDSQIMQLELQNKQVLDQAAGLSADLNIESSKQIQDALTEIAQRLQQMTGLKHELVSQKDTIANIALENVIVTGNLENYVELEVGQNLYDAFKNAEIIVKDGVIQDIID